MLKCPFEQMAVDSRRDIAITKIVMHDLVTLRYWRDGAYEPNRAVRQIARSERLRIMARVASYGIPGIREPE